MIFKASKRSGGRQLGSHLLKTEENEHVEIHEVSGFVSDSIMGAMNEAYAASRGTRCKQYLFSLSLSPPAHESVRVEVFEKALKNVSPNFEVKSRRVGGANYQIPFPVAGHRAHHYAFMWLVTSARGRNGMPYNERLAAEIVDAYNEAGAAFKKKEDTHRMAEANRAFAHFARG